MSHDASAGGGVEEVIRRAYAIAEDVGRRVEDLVSEDTDELDEQSARALYRKIIEVMKRAAANRGDRRTVERLSADTEVILSGVMKARRRAAAAVASRNGKRIGTSTLGAPDDAIGTVRQVFHGRKVDMYRRRVPTLEMELWAGNERIDVHLGQFKALNGRAPSHEELLAIMTGALKLPGVAAGEDRASAEDPFGIADLAANIAKNGLRVPPILDNDGVTLLDGNRRVTACYFMLNHPDYSAETKKLVEEIEILQLTEHADDEDREAVIVALNFEDDCKKQWPDYVRAKKLKSEFDKLCRAVGQQNLDDKKVKAIRKRLSQQFALRLSDVSRFLNMTSWVERFETYQIDVVGKDEHQVKHFAKNKFSYFKELADIDDVLLKDDAYRALVFDLFYRGMFPNWPSVRRLRYNDEQLERELRAASAESDDEIAKRNIGIALDTAYQRHMDKRPPLGAKEQIENFARFLGKLPPESYLDPETVPTASLIALKSLCTMALKNVEEALEARVTS
jgi:hypothetical protein